MSGGLRDLVIEWAARSVTQGEVLDGFAEYCEELDDVRVIEQTPLELQLEWKERDRSTVALASGIPAAAPRQLTLLIAGLSPEVVTPFLEDDLLRTRLAVYDLMRLEKINAVRSSVFVYFEWFLRDRYGVKLLTSAAFTRGLVERGIISLGMG